MSKAKTKTKTKERFDLLEEAYFDVLKVFRELDGQRQVGRRLTPLQKQLRERLERVLDTLEKLYLDEGRSIDQLAQAVEKRGAIIRNRTEKTWKAPAEELALQYVHNHNYKFILTELYEFVGGKFFKSPNNVRNVLQTRIGRKQDFIDKAKIRLS